MKRNYPLIGEMLAFILSIAMFSALASMLIQDNCSLKSPFDWHSSEIYFNDLQDLKEDVISATFMIVSLLILPPNLNE